MEVGCPKHRSRVEIENYSVLCFTCIAVFEALYTVLLNFGQGQSSYTSDVSDLSVLTHVQVQQYRTFKCGYAMKQFSISTWNSHIQL